MEQRRTFGQDAELYDRVRPSYPNELLDDVVELTGVPCRALDVGCGTGKATLQLAVRGIEGIGIEPDAAMAAVAARKLEQWPGWHVEISDFEPWQPSDPETFDLITAATAWHWIDRERGARQAERLLRSGGWLAIFDRRPNEPDTPLRREIDAAYAKYAPKPSARSRASGERVPAGCAFESPILRQYPGWRDYTAEQWLDEARTSSDQKMLPAERRDALRQAVMAAIEKHGGMYRHHFVYELWASRRL